MRNITENSGAGLEAEPKLESLFSLYITLLIGKKTQNIEVTKGNTEVWYLQGCIRVQTEVILMILKVEQLYSNQLADLLGWEYLEL